MNDWFGRRLRITALILILSSGVAHISRAEPGVFDDRVVFGQSAAFKGPAAALGIGMRDGDVIRPTGGGVPAPGQPYSVVGPSTCF